MIHRTYVSPRVCRIPTNQLVQKHAALQGLGAVPRSMALKTIGVRLAIYTWTYEVDRLGARRE